MKAQNLIEMLGLEKHPEGGWYRQTFKDREMRENRAYSTAIYYLLQKGECSRWHRVDATEIWHYYAGAPLKLSISPDGNSTRDHILGKDLFSGQKPQLIVEKMHWQSATSLGEWTLCGCTVSPGFEFSGFEMAKEGWKPGSGSGSGSGSG